MSSSLVVTDASSSFADVSEGGVETINIFSLSESDRETTLALGAQVIRQHQADIVSGSTVADIRDQVMSALSDAVEVEGDERPNYRDPCFQVSDAYIRSRSLPRLNGALRGACPEIGLLATEQVVAGNLQAAVLIAESLRIYCQAADIENMPDPILIGLEYNRFDLVTNILNDRIHYEQEQQLCRNLPSGPERDFVYWHAVEEQLGIFLAKYPGNLSSLTWTWSPELLAIAQRTIESVSLSNIGNIGRADHVAKQEALQRDRAFIAGRLQSAR